MAEHHYEITLEWTETMAVAHPVTKTTAGLTSSRRTGYRRFAGLQIHRFAVPQMRGILSSCFLRLSRSVTC